MLAVMLAAIQAATSIILGLHTQYYSRLADEAAESGANYAAACMKANGMTTPWVTAGKQLAANTDCSGNVISGANTYIEQSTTTRTSFVVDNATSDSNVVRLSITGTTELLRSATGNVWRTYTQHLVSNVSMGSVVASYISSGGQESCGIISGQTWCWGLNTDGQLGNGTTTDSNVPVQVSRLTGGLAGKTDKMVAVGNWAACIVTTDNLIYCMGHNYVGQLGDGTATDRHVPTAVDMSTGLAGKTITDIAAGPDQTCVVASGDVYCWGGDEHGQLGINSTSTSLKPVLVQVIGASRSLPVTELSSTIYMPYTCAIANGAVYCWGDNTRGQLGDGTTTDKYVPTSVITTSGIGSRQAISIATGANYPATYPTYSSTANGMETGQSCAAMTDGTAFCWGANQYGQMGQGTTSLTPQTQPIQLGGALAGKKVIQVSTAMSTPCAMTDEVKIYCWGLNVFGSVGDGTTTDRYTPTPVVVQDPGLLGKTPIVLTSGGNRNCTIASNKAYCWGLNSDGQLGDGTYTNRSVPTEAKYLSRVQPIAYF